MEERQREQTVGYTHEVRIEEMREEAIRAQVIPFLQGRHYDFRVESLGNGIRLLIKSKARSEEEAEQQREQLEQDILSKLVIPISPEPQGRLQQRIGELLDQQHMTLATIESLTGGLIASALTDQHASSEHFIGGIVAYSVVLKEWMGVPHETIERYGVISPETARAMAKAIRKSMGVEVGLGITGVAGPDEQEGQPVGTVYIAIDGPYGILNARGAKQCASDDREANKLAATLSALYTLKHYLEKQNTVGELFVPEW